MKPSSPNDAHLPLGPGHDLAAILCRQERRVVANDYTIRLDNRVYQLLPPAWPGERGGEVVVELRLDGSTHVRFKQRYLPFREVPPPAKAPEAGAAEAGAAGAGSAGALAPAAGFAGPAPGPLGALPPNPRSLTPGPIPAGAAGAGQGRGEESERRGRRSGPASCGTSGRRALGSHSCGALSSRRRTLWYRTQGPPSSATPSLRNGR